MGYVWCDGYVWDMCGVRYANNLLKNPATKRLSGKNETASLLQGGPIHQEKHGVISITPINSQKSMGNWSYVTPTSAVISTYL